MRTDRPLRAFIAFVLALALSVPLVLAGCSSSQDQSTETDALTVWVRDTDDRSYLEDAFDLYRSETGNELNVRIIDSDDYSGMLERAFVNGTAPDVILHYNDSNLAELGLLDHFLVLNDQEWVDSLMAGARAYCDDGNGNLMGLPFWESSLSGCYYNKSILSKLGLKPASTQAEFDMLCSALRSVGYTPLFWGDACGWMYQFGLDPIFADHPELIEQLNSGEIDYSDIPQVRDMVQWIHDANQKGWLGDPAGKGYDDVSATMASGEAAMVDIWDTWFFTDLVPGEFDAEDFAVMPIFMGTSDEGTYEGGNLNMMLVNKDAKHLDEAIGLLEFCARPEVYNEVFEGVPSVKVFKDQDTIVTADMLVDASDSIAKLERASTANPKIQGYSQEDMVKAFTALLNGEVSVDGCIALMDELRLESLQR